MNSRTHPFGLLAFLHWNHEWNKWHFRDDVLHKALQQLQGLGVGFVRIDVLWSDVHRGLYQYDFSRYDQLIETVKKHGLEILAILHYNKVSQKDGQELWNRPPESFEEFAKYVGACV